MSGIPSPVKSAVIIWTGYVATGYESGDAKSRAGQVAPNRVPANARVTAPAMLTMRTGPVVLMVSSAVLCWSVLSEGERGIPPGEAEPCAGEEPRLPLFRLWSLNKSVSDGSKGRNARLRVG